MVMAKEEEWSIKFDEQTFDHVIEVFNRFKNEVGKDLETSLAEDERLAAYLTIAYFIKANYQKPPWEITLPPPERKEPEGGS